MNDGLAYDSGGVTKSVNDSNGKDRILNVIEFRFLFESRCTWGMMGKFSKYSSKCSISDVYLCIDVRFQNFNLLSTEYISPG